MPSRLNLQNSRARTLFAPEQWEKIQQNPTARLDETTWASFSAVQKSAVLELRKAYQNDGFGQPNGRDDGNRLQGGAGGRHWVGRGDPLQGRPAQEAAPSVKQVLEQAKAAPGNARVKEPWDALPPNRMMAMALNAENLFRESDDPNRDDSEFLPAAGYTKEKFYEHLDNIGELIKSVNGGRGPEILALTEVEDKRALEKLVGNELEGMGYHTIALEEGHDRRGIDVGLVTKYPLWPRSAPRLVFPPGDTAGQRGILRTELEVNGKKTVVYVNHWKSMRDGEDVAARENTRIAAALQADIQATVAADPRATVMVLGDFNTKFYDGQQGAMEALGSTPSGEALSAGQLWDATHTIPARRGEGVEHPLLPEGTHAFRGEFDFLDRFMVNGNAASGAGGIKFDPDSLVVLPTPGRFFGRGGGGNTIANGISDHKPLVAQFELS